MKIVIVCISTLLSYIVLLSMNKTISLSIIRRGFRTKKYSKFVISKQPGKFNEFAKITKIITSEVIDKVVHNEISKSYEDLISNKVFVRNTQKYQNIDINRVKLQTFEILKALNVSNFEVDVLFCSDEKIKKLNYENRNVKKATDILSFPICDFSSPGIFSEDCFMQGHLHLGDIVIAPTYVMNVSNQDKENFEKFPNDFEDLSDAGVSKAMSKVFTFEERLPLLMIHGILHLLGYDHETDEEWKVMTNKETELIELLKSNKII